MNHDPTQPPDPPEGNVPEPSLRRRLLARILGVGLVLLALGGAGLWGVYQWHRPAPPPPADPPRANTPEDPRLTYAGPFLNIHPDVAYVGDGKCSECHEKETLAFRQHPMGRSLLPIARVAPHQRYDAEANNPFPAFGTLFLVHREGDHVVHRQIGRDSKGQTVYESDTPIDYVLGSGARGHSYLTDRGGYLFETPVSWYTQKHIWDASPGFANRARAGRPVPGACLFCHANRARPLEGYVNRYEEPVFDGYAIGCERCHGPAERHVRSPGRKDPATGADYTILNPARLEPKLRAAVCEQCHLAGAGRVLRRGRDLYDFRPGLPMEAFWSIFVPTFESAEDSKAVGHVEQMYQSRCFLRSRESPAEGRRKLGCTSCHDPHQYIGPETRVAHYRARCLTCHESQERPCSAPLETRRLKGDSCIDCHMPRYSTSDIAHTAATDHRVILRADKGATAQTNPVRHEPNFASFYHPQPDPDDKELGRDRALALIQVFNQGKMPRGAAGGQILELLDAAARNDPDDLEVLEARGMTLMFQRHPAEALAAYEAVLAKAPRREVSLAQAAVIAQQQRRFDLARSYWERVVAEVPYEVSYRESLAQLLAQQNAWDEARPQCEAWLRLDPANIEARVLWVSCLLRTGDKPGARAEFARIQRLAPPNLPLLEARFAVELR
jgi:predicted CXXCH cytochrome family protein